MGVALSSRNVNFNASSIKSSRRDFLKSQRGFPKTPLDLPCTGSTGLNLKHNIGERRNATPPP